MLMAWVQSYPATPLLRLAPFVRPFAAGLSGPQRRPAGTREIVQLTDDVARMAGDLEQKQSALAASTERHRRMVEGAYDAILTADPETGSILEVNNRFCQMFGYELAEVGALA